MRPIKESSLTPARRRLLRLLQVIKFGRIRNLHIRNADPVLDPLPKVIRTVKLGSSRGSRVELNTHDFVLKKQVVEMFEEFNRLGDGTIEHLEVQNGLPFIMDTEENACLI